MEYNLTIIPTNPETPNGLLIINNGQISILELYQQLGRFGSDSTIYFSSTEQEQVQKQNEPIQLNLLKEQITYFPGSGIIRLNNTTPDARCTKISRNPNNIFKALVEHSNSVVDRRDLLGVLDERLDNIVPTNTHVIDVHVSFIRKALEQHRTSLRSVRGKGFIFDDF